MVATPGGIDAAARSRSHRASAGLAPPVETATVTGPSRWTAGSWMVPGLARSALLTSTPAADGIGHDGTVDLGPPGGGGHQVVAGRLAGLVGAALDPQRRGLLGRGRMPRPGRGAPGVHDEGDDGVIDHRRHHGHPCPAARSPRALRAATDPPPHHQAFPTTHVQHHRVVERLVAGRWLWEFGHGGGWAGQATIVAPPAISWSSDRDCSKT